MKIYLFIFNNMFGSRDQAISIIKQIPDIKGWRSDMPNAIYLQSECNSQQLCDSIRSKRGVGKFLIVEITSNRQGYLSKESWNFLKIQKEG